MNDCREDCRRIIKTFLFSARNAVQNEANDLDKTAAYWKTKDVPADMIVLAQETASELRTLAEQFK